MIIPLRLPGETAQTEREREIERERDMERDDDWWRRLTCTGNTHDKAVVDHLMLRYRPIAPKPVTGQPFAGGENSPYGTSRRTKRKYVRVSKNNKTTAGRSRKGRSGPSDRENDQNIPRDVVTLQLLPEKAHSTEESTPLGSRSLDPTVGTVIGGTATWNRAAAPTAEMARRREVETWVTVESVTGSCDTDVGGYSYAFGYTDVEIMGSLDKDTRPGFVSDGSNRVMWVNEAYRKMVSGENDGRSPETAVWLVTDEAASFHGYASFTCRVRLEYTCHEAKYTKTVPCDVQKMAFGGFAWRLDTRAALTLWL